MWLDNAAFLGLSITSVPHNLSATYTLKVTEPGPRKAAERWRGHEFKDLGLEAELTVCFAKRNSFLSCLQPASAIMGSDFKEGGVQVNKHRIKTVSEGKVQ